MAALSPESVQQLQSYSTEKASAVSALVMRDLGFSDDDRRKVSMAFYNKASGRFSSSGSAFQYPTEGRNEILRGNFKFEDKSVEFFLNARTNELVVGEMRELMTVEKATGKVTLGKSEGSLIQALNSVAKSDKAQMDQRVRVELIAQDGSMVCVVGVTPQQGRVKVCESAIGDVPPAPFISKTEVKGLFPGRTVAEDVDSFGNNRFKLNAPMELSVPLKVSRIIGASKEPLGDAHQSGDVLVSRDGLDLSALKLIGTNSQKIVKKDSK